MSNPTTPPVATSIPILPETQLLPRHPRPLTGRLPYPTVVLWIFSVGAQVDGRVVIEDSASGSAGRCFRWGGEGEVGREEGVVVASAVVVGCGVRGVGVEGGCVGVVEGGGGVCGGVPACAATVVAGG